jgi:hypothetical protein
MTKQYDLVLREVKDIIRNYNIKDLIITNRGLNE